MTSNAKLFQDYINGLQSNLKLGNATEHTHRTVLKTLLESVGDRVTATNEPRRIECGAPDFVVTKSAQNQLTVGYVEAKDAGYDLEQIERDSKRVNPSTTNGRQLKRYRESLPNLLLTNYTEFRWYVDGEPRMSACIANASSDSRLSRNPAEFPQFNQLLWEFLEKTPERIASPKDLAQRMARLTYMIRDIIGEGFRQGHVSQDVEDLYDATRRVLVPDLTEEAFADMFAQTLAYGLFAARVNHRAGPFRRQDAAHRIPPTNPFLRQFFSVVTGPTLDDEPFVSFVDDLTQLLGSADMEAILSDFGKRAARQDPIMHFYETFLAAYDPALREQRGVYYTPEPVVSYIVRSVDWLLRQHFDCPAGLADHAMTHYEYVDHKEKKERKQSHRVLVLDPACGTGTFLYAVIDHIRDYYRKSGNTGMWNGYVKEHLLKRLFGFELLMAPYAMSHLKLGMQLAAQDMPAESRADWSYEFDSDERLGVYLTNSLEQAEAQSMTLFGPLRVITEEANAAAIKRDLPIMVVLGNPPYSGHSANKSNWIIDLVGDYKQGHPDLQKPGQAKWLQDDYVKFIRFGQWRIDESGAGILGFVTNHSYLDNPTFRGMRLSLMKSFDEIYLLDLHGNAKRKERAPDGSLDQNVFDIQQGVAISLFLKRKKASHGLARIFYSELWGERGTEFEGGKYGWLAANSISTTQWTELAPKSPGFLFIPRDEALLEQYESGWSVPEIFSLNGGPGPGIVTTHDQFAISWTPEQAASKVEQFLSTTSEDEARTIWRLCSQNQWNYDRAKKELADGSYRNRIRQILYRPFDVRNTVFDRNVAVHRRKRVMNQMLAKENLGLIFMRQVALQDAYTHFGVARTLVDNRAFYSNKGILSFSPLYIYPSAQEISSGLYSPDERRPNLDPGFTQHLERHLDLDFIPDGKGDLHETFGPEDVLHYIYAVFHSPTYRQRYSQFLRADFPRVPNIDDVELFRALIGMGRQLTQLHLMESPSLSQTGIGFPVPGDYVVESGYPKYVPPGGSLPGQAAPLEEGSVYISKDNSRSGKRGQYFEGISPEVWEFRIGGYQPMEKWLKDRRGRTLSFEDLNHYQRMAVALAETGRLMEEIDAEIEARGGLFT